MTKLSGTKVQSYRNYKKQVLLIQPWVEDFYITDCRLQPIG
ncbi:MAG: hypothetical protein ACD_79C00570G0001, partial [uncultured bacterium]